MPAHVFESSTVFLSLLDQQLLAGGIFVSNLHFDQLAVHQCFVFSFCLFRDNQCCFLGLHSLPSITSQIRRAKRGRWSFLNVSFLWLGLNTAQVPSSDSFVLPAVCSLNLQATILMGLLFPMYATNLKCPYPRAICKADACLPNMYMHISQCTAPKITPALYSTSSTV